MINVNIINIVNGRVCKIDFSAESSNKMHFDYFFSACSQKSRGEATAKQRRGKSKAGAKQKRGNGQPTTGRRRSQRASARNHLGIPK